MESKSKILITGGTGRIGSELVRNMVADGHHVTLTCRSKESGVRFLAESSLPKAMVSIVTVDFTKSGALELIVGELTKDINVVIHNARAIDSLSIGQDGGVTAEQFHKEYEMGVVFPYQLTKFLAEKNSSLKDIVFISSMYGVVGPNPLLYDNFTMQSPINYGVVKAAQIHLTKELAIRYSEKGIRCNCISYGGVEGRVDEAFKERYGKLNPMGRMLNNNDLYPPIKYLLGSPELGVTGQNIVVDGGWTIW